MLCQGNDMTNASSRRSGARGHGTKQVTWCWGTSSPLVTRHTADWRLHKVLLLLYGEEELNKKKIWGWVVWDKRIRICSFFFYQRHADREKSLWCRNINMLPSRFSRYFHLTLLRSLSLSLCIYLLHSVFSPDTHSKNKVSLRGFACVGGK